MIEVVSAFVVREEARGQFELAFGPGGMWGKLFTGWPGYRGTTLLRDTGDSRRYLTIDVWESEAQREQMLAGYEAECATMDAALEAWVTSRTEIGVYRMLAEATVRARGRGRRDRTR